MASESANSSGLSSPKSASTPSALGFPSPQASLSEATPTAPNNGSQSPVSEALGLEIDVELAEQSANMETDSWNALNPPVPSPGPVSWEPQSEDEAPSAALDVSNTDMDDPFDIPTDVTDSDMGELYRNDSHLVPEIPHFRGVPSTQGEESFLNPVHLDRENRDNLTPQPNPNAGNIASFQETRNRRANEFISLAENQPMFMADMLFAVEDMREDAEEFRKLAARLSPAPVPHCFNARCQSISNALATIEASLHEKEDMRITQPDVEMCMCLFIGLAVAQLILIPTAETDEASSAIKVRTGEINRALARGSALPAPYSGFTVTDSLHRMWQSLYTYHETCQCEQCNVARQAGR